MHDNSALIGQAFGAGPTRYQIRFSGPEQTGEETLLLTDGTIRGLGWSRARINGIYNVDPNAGVVELTMAMTLPPFHSSGSEAGKGSLRPPIVIKAELPAGAERRSLVVDSLDGPYAIELKKSGAISDH